MPALLGLFVTILLSVSLAIVYHKQVVATSKWTLKALFALAGLSVFFAWCWNAWDFLRTRAGIVDHAVKNAYDTSLQGWVFWTPIVVFGTWAIWDESRPQLQKIMSRLRTSIGTRKASTAAPPRAFQTLEQPVDADLVRVLSDALDKRLAALRKSHLDVFRTARVRPPEVGLTPEQAIAADIESLIAALTKWYDSIPDEMHKAFEKDGTSVLALFQSAAANNSNYQFIIESKVIRAASEAFAAAIGEVEAALPTIDVSVINNLEQAWAQQKFLLQQRSYESLEAEADKAKQTGDPQAILQFAEQQIADDLEAKTDLFKQVFFRTLNRELTKLESESSVIGKDWSPFVSRKLVSELFSRDIPDDKYAYIEAVAVQWLYVSALIDSERSEADAELPRKYQARFEWLCQAEEGKDLVAKHVALYVERAYGGLESEGFAIAQRRVDEILAP